jgi:hypothetical protein
MSGRKIAGCCVHIACLIYFLSYARYNTIKPPAEHLNSIFVNMRNESAANNPKYIRNKREQKKEIEPELISSESDFDLLSETDIFIEEHPKNSNKDHKKTSQNRKSKTTKRKKAQRKIQSVHSSIDTTNEEEVDEPDKEYESIHKFSSIEEIVQTFKSHVPFWGGNIKYKGKSVKLTNTCTIDNFLYGFWVAFKTNNIFWEQIPLLKHTEKIKLIIMSINNLEWNTAKEL